MRRSSYRRDSFADGKSCVTCGSPLSLQRLHHPLRDNGTEMSDHRLNLCGRGELTLFRPDGVSQRVKIAIHAGERREAANSGTIVQSVMVNDISTSTFVGTAVPLSVPGENVHCRTAATAA
jgi:hypothetical protein